MHEQGIENLNDFVEPALMPFECQTVKLLQAPWCWGTKLHHHPRHGEQLPGRGPQR